jgi:hypothetical protein
MLYNMFFYLVSIKKSYIFAGDNLKQSFCLKRLMPIKN